MKLLMRHQTCPLRADMPDHQRPLDMAGRAEALAMGGRIRDEGLIIDTILHSSARRTTETAQLVREGYGECSLQSSDELYNCDADTVSAKLRDGSLIVAHNPAIETLATRLMGSPQAIAPGTVLIVDELRLLEA